MFRMTTTVASRRIILPAFRERDHSLGRYHSIIHAPTEPKAIKDNPRLALTTPEIVQPVAMSKGTSITPPAHSSLAGALSGFCLGIFPPWGTTPSFSSILLNRRLSLPVPGIRSGLVPYGGCGALGMVPPLSSVPRTQIPLAAHKPLISTRFVCKATDHPNITIPVLLLRS